MAAEDYINSPSEEEDERLLGRLSDKVMQAREIVRTEREAPAQSETASTP